MVDSDSMVFSSMIFLWLFLPLLLFFYFISKSRFRNIILLVASLIFYAWGEPKYIFLMLASIFVNYVIGLILDRYRKYDKFVLIVAILLNLGILGYFKYFNFFIDFINKIFGFSSIGFREIILPIGISFYTFQILSYIVDLYRKEIKVQKNFFDLALYVSFFPQLIAGPIVKYKDVEKEIKQRTVNLELFSSGIRRFVYGLSKKVIFSNTLALIVDSIYDSGVTNLNTPLVWLITISYTMQIYFDFSGYSDMAIGLGRMFGFHFSENFNLPYISQSITEFWRRWHISLSTWFKQYLYIPLGGNRKGKVRTYLNLFIVFFATGLWHGASFNFIVWGLYYGVFLIFEKMIFHRFLDWNPYKFLHHFYVMLVVMIGWILFRANNLSDAFYMIQLMFSFNFKQTYAFLPSFINFKTILILLLSVLFSGIVQKVFSCLSEKGRNKIKYIYHEKLEFLVIIFLMIICIFELVASSYNPFIYFRF